MAEFFLSVGEVTALSLLGIIAYTLGLLLYIKLFRLKGVLIILAIEVALCAVFAMSGVNFIKCLIVCAMATLIVWPLKWVIRKFPRNRS